MRASGQDGDHPRPQLVREGWASLDGPWEFAHDDRDEGRAARWFTAVDAPFDRRITVPYPPESPASGIGERGFHPVVWYRRTVPHRTLATEGGGRTLVHFGAVDFAAEVWCDGHLVASHAGGQTPFTADVTDAVDATAAEHMLVVRACDDPADVEQPRGKQDWRERPHNIWYERTTGIWQPVWVERVPPQHVAELAWAVDVPGALVQLEVELAHRPTDPVVLEAVLTLGDELLAEQSTTVTGRTASVAITVDALRNGQDRRRLLWTPANPVLVDARIRLRDRGTGEVLDEVSSYLGMRTVGVADGRFLLNGEPVRLRAVLAQGYRETTHLAAAGTEVLRKEVRQVKRLGFNAVRVHQKAEDPRFLYWADRLGLMVWGETAAAYAWSNRAASLLTTEWLDIVRRDRSHPCVVTWVPINESWGVQDIAVHPSQQRFAAAIAGLTRALDPTRPVLSNEGWEHVDSDILGVHDYSSDPGDLQARYGTSEAVARLRAGLVPAGRRTVLGPTAGQAPLMITEFGGVSTGDTGGWGYSTVGSGRLADHLRALFDAVRACPDVAGFCYTQLADTGQETNGLLTAEGRPKLPWPVLRAIVTGRPVPAEPVGSDAAADEDGAPPEGAAAPDGSRGDRPDGP